MQNRFFDPLDELQGYLELGMAKEALGVAKAVLKRRPISAGEFAQAVEAVLILADRLKPWRRRIESAYETLGPKEQERSAEKMLDFYVSVADWPKAGCFVPRQPTHATTLVFCMWTYLNLRQMEKARSLSKKCLHLLQRSDGEFSTSCLLEALGSYYAQAGEWDTAQAAWESGQEFTSFAVSAWEGLVQLHAYRGLLQANVAFEAAKANVFLQDDCLMLPGNSSCRCADVDKRFHRHAKHLARVIPPGERWRFGR